MKKGELTTTQIVTLIVLILSFSIILFFYVQFDWRSQTDREICKNSVVMRSSLPAGEETIPLNCRTEQVCLSFGGECSEAVSDARIVKIKTKSDIFEELANLMHDCWWQMGEGDLDYQPKTFLGSNYCAMCSVIYFDEDIAEEYVKIADLDFYNYLAQTNIPGSETSYLQYLYGTESLEEIRTQIISQTELGDISENYFNLNEPYTIITSLEKEGNLLKSIGVGSAIGLVSASVVGLSGGAGLLVIGGAVAGGGGGTFLGHIWTNDNGYFIKPLLVPYNAKDIIEGLECKEFSTLY